MNAILGEFESRREQMLVSMEDIAHDFEFDAFVAAAASDDARERNKVAAVERNFEVLLNWLDELAARALSEGQRLGVVDKQPGYPWDRLVTLGVISKPSAERLQEAKEMRDVLSHAYPPQRWQALHEGVQTLMKELDSFVDQVGSWAHDQGIL
ncbi:MAG: HepT-like ribonuclease domain-containing protein [Thermoleophilaceae bacterium]